MINGALERISLSIAIRTSAGRRLLWQITPFWAAVKTISLSPSSSLHTLSKTFQRDSSQSKSFGCSPNARSTLSAKPFIAFAFAEYIMTVPV